MKRYDSYKDSGTIWFNEVPKNWIVTKIKYFCYKVVNGATPSTNNPSYWDGDIPWIPSGMCHDCEIVEADKFITEEGYCNSSTKKIPANTTLVALTGATCSKTGYLLFESCTNQSIAALINRNGTFSKYFFYLLQSLRPQLLTYQTGGAQAGVNVGNCKNLIGLFPSYKEQKNICSYLDSKCGEVDKVISTQEKRIALLQELKQSIITHAVTKGLNPDVKMKDSGIEWIGEVPEHWDCAPFKRFMNIKNGQDYKSFQSDDGYPVIGSGGCFAYCTRFIYDGESLLLGRKGTIDKPLYVNGKFWTVDTMFYSIPQKNCSVRYMYYQSLTIPFERYYTSTALPSMTQTDLGLNNFCFPPIPEQQEIASYLDKRCAQIDASISKAQKEIELLLEYKQSLITEVVTGKRKVC